MTIRIILDEAHTIKNRNTAASKAATEIDASFRWCLTGTPIQNSMTDLFAMVRFLRIEPYNDWSFFNRRIVKPFAKGRRASAVERVKVIMKGNH